MSGETELSDHSRYLLRLRACADEQALTVQANLEATAAPCAGLRGARKVAIRSRRPDDHYGIFFGAHPIAAIDLTQDRPVSHVAGLNTRPAALIQHGDDLTRARAASAA